MATELVRNEWGVILRADVWRTYPFAEAPQALKKSRSALAPMASAPT